MAKRRVWPRNADDYRVAAITAAHATRNMHVAAIQTILNDLAQMREVDRTILTLAAERIGRHTAEINANQADIERWLTLAKFGEPDEGE